MEDADEDFDPQELLESADVYLTVCMKDDKLYLLTDLDGAEDVLELLAKASTVVKFSAGIIDEEDLSEDRTLN